MFISVTYLELKSLSKFFSFIKYTFRVMQQMKTVPGLKKQQTRARGPYRYYTLTGWNDKESMMKFRNSGAHLDAARITKKIASKADAINFEADELPTWKQAFEMMDKYQLNKTK